MQRYYFSPLPVVKARRASGMALVLLLVVVLTVPTNGFRSSLLATRDHPVIAASTTMSDLVDQHVSRNDSDTSQGTSMVEYSKFIGKLKTTPRVGWAIRGVPDHESVADHSWRVAALCFLLPRDQYNVGKCLEMAVVHDMAEVVVGDITPEDNVPKDEKQRLELNAMHEIVALLKGKDEDSGHHHLPQNNGNDSDGVKTHQYLLDIFHEYEERNSKEAVAVKDLDMLDMILQADEYEGKYSIDMSDFFDGNPVEKFVVPELREAAKEVHRCRQQRIDSMKHATKEKDRSSVVEQSSASDSVSHKDQDFVKAFAAESGMESDKIRKVVKALRDFESSGC